MVKTPPAIAGKKQEFDPWVWKIPWRRRFQYSCREKSMNRMKKQKDMTLKDELPKSVAAQYAIGEEWRNNSRKNEEIRAKAKTASSCGCDW